MKKNFLPTKALTAFVKKTYKGFFVFALALTFTLDSFAHRAEPFVIGCVTPGQNMQIDAYIFSAGASTMYRWQYKETATSNWKCFVNGVNTINGVNFTVSGATGGPAANNAPLLTISNAQVALENVLVRVLMRDNSLPVCSATLPAGHTSTGDTYGGDDQALNETKYLRLHVFASATICPPNAYACTNNLLVVTGAANVSGGSSGYYGGFENIGYTEATGVYVKNNIINGSLPPGLSPAFTDYTLGATGNTNKTYFDFNNPSNKDDAYTRNIAPHSGNYQLIVEGSSTTSTTTDRVWYKTQAVAINNQYRFDAWVAKIDATNPTIQLRAGTTVLATVDMTSTAVGTWKLVHGVFTATSTTNVTFSIRETTGSKNFCLDDICLSVCTSCGALPLHQLDLKANLQGNNVSLKWIAENEMNTNEFVIERSADGNNYDEIGNTAPTGPVNTPTQYNFSDDIQSINSSSIIYYRIKASDHEGRFAYSNIATVRLGKTAGVQVWPNPFGDFVNITYNASANTKVDVSLVNTLGKVVKQSNYSVTRGFNQIAVGGLETLSSGIYFIRITDKSTNEVYIQKISK